MSEIQECKGGDGWSSWVVMRDRNGLYSVTVTSNAERSAGGGRKIVHLAEGMTDGRAAINTAISKSTQYAYRMAS